MQDIASQVSSSLRSLKSLRHFGLSSLFVTSVSQVSSFFPSAPLDTAFASLSPLGERKASSPGKPGADRFSLLRYELFSTFQPFNPSTLQLFNSSTLQLFNLLDPFDPIQNSTFIISSLHFSFFPRNLPLETGACLPASFF
jgi:hypothetical protein